MTTYLPKLTKGNPDNLGLSIQGNLTNFTLFSHHAEKVILGLFWEGHTQEFPLYRTGDIWHGALTNIPKNATYAYRCIGPKKLFPHPEKWLADPYAKVLKDLTHTYATLPPPFDWQGVQAPKIADKDLIIYEIHIRGFTKHHSSKVSSPGTYLGFIEKIPHLKRLGINAVEFLPIHEFDETYKHPKPLINYWGYNSTHFFAPKKLYAHLDPVNEFKTLVRELHRNGILVILDVVYNHTGEGKEKDYFVNFRGIDDSTYYLLEADGSYSDYSGCGNTLNCNHPAVQKLILDSLHYWVEEMHVDGFRFDLASILTRGVDGKPMEHPPIIEKISKDPLLKTKKLIAEAWDANSLYQLGAFPKWGKWSEWNGYYRDQVRRFIKGTDDQAGPFASAIAGSDTLYRKSKTPLSSINFITAHDGFSLRDLVSYQDKHNWENGENNQDGNSQNDNWNCGIEGKTNDPKIKALRERQMRNFLLALFISQGTPMILMGDEYGHTRKGNNNPYVQDNEINWFLWDQMDVKIVHFVSSLITFRQKHPCLKKETFLTDADIKWFNNWDASSRFVSFCLEKTIYCAFNADFEKIHIALPEGKWKTVVYTKEDWIFHTDGAPISSIELEPYSALVAIAIP